MNAGENTATLPIAERYDTDRAPYFVYVIAADNGEVKVGYSGSPCDRFSTIKRHYAGRRGFKTANLVGYVATDLPLHVEFMAQRELKPHWQGGEWFRCDPEFALRIVLEWALMVSNFNVRVYRPD